jgi:hypothetical protein
MSLSTNKALVKSFVEEVFNKHDISAAEKYFAEEQPPIGIEEFKKILSDQFVFPRSSDKNITFAIDDTASVEGFGSEQVSESKQKSCLNTNI